MSNKKTTIKKEGVAAVAVGLAAAVAAGAYFLYGSKDAEKNRKKIKVWSVKMKADVMDKIEKLKEIDEEVYKTVVSSVASKYAKLKNVDTAEVEALAADLNKHWKAIKKHVDTETKAATKIVKKDAKVLATKTKETAKVVKKETKKAVKEVKAAL
jgi:uncharacterized protein YicC (UPF0701 family)